MIRLASIGAFCLALVANAAYGNLLTNGSFETPQVSENTYQVYNPGDTGLTGWTILAQIAQDGTFFSCCGYSGLPASDGNDWLDMTGNNDNGTGGISQTVTTIVGHTYQLSLDVGNAYSTNSGPGATSTIVTTVTGTGGFSDENDVQTNTTNWVTFVHTFVATSTSTTLTFSNGDPNGDNLNPLDNIVLLDVTSSAPVNGVPEPEILPLLAFGLGAAVVRRRRLR